MNPRQKRALRAAFLFLAGLLVLVIAGGVAAVGWSTRVLRGGTVRSWVNDDPEKLFLDYDEASSSWPGHIHVRGLRLRGRDPNVEWEFRIEDCRIAVSLPDLLRKKFHARSVRATGLAFRLRQRIEPSRATSSRVRFIPRIEGFAAVPLRDRPVLRPAQNARDLWSVQIDSLAASPVREIWVDAYRYTGNANLTGQLLLRPRLQASVGPARLTWRDGTLVIFGKPAAAPIRARIDCRIASYDPSRVRGPAVWDFISARADWSGRLAGIEFFDPLFGGPPLLSGGRGTMSGRIRVDRGKGEARIELAAEGAAAQYPKERLLGNVSAELRMSPWRPGLGIADVAGSSVTLRNVKAPSEESREWWGDFRTVSGSLRSVPRGLRLTAKVDSKCRDARPLYTLFGVGLPRWTRGLAALEGFSGHAGVDFAPAQTRIDDLDASGGSFRVRGDFLRKGASKQGAFLVEDGPLRVGVEIDDSSSRLRVFGVEKWFRERASASSKGM
jgi:hypothetical protein